MRNTLHRKKLQLALESMGGSNARVDARGRVDELDHNWVLSKLFKAHRWSLPKLRPFIRT